MNPPIAHPELAANGYIRLNQLVPHVVPISRATWWRWVAEGRAPKPVKLGPAVTAWRVADIKTFLEAQGAEP